MEKQHKGKRWVHYSEIQPEQVAHGVQRRVLAYGDSAMCVENTFEKGAIGAMHSHPHTQVTYIVSGRFCFTIGEEVREVCAGDTLLKENGVVHGCTCLESGVMIDFFSPMREDFVK